MSVARRAPGAGGRKAVLTLLRGVVRAVRRVAQNPEGTGTVKYVFEQFRAHQGETDKRRLQELRALAADTLSLLESTEIKTRFMALDTGRNAHLKGSDRMRAAAQRVGLELPEAAPFSEELYQTEFAAAARPPADSPAGLAAAAAASLKGAARAHKPRP